MKQRVLNSQHLTLLELNLVGLPPPIPVCPCSFHPIKPTYTTALIFLQAVAEQRRKAKEKKEANREKSLVVQKVGR